MIPKFRAWHTPFTDNKFGQEMKYGRAGTLLSFAEMSPNDYILMQSTGLKDLSGVEIFEGDILFDKHHNPQIGVVVFYEGAFQLLANNMYYPLIQFDGDVEIIGNIHENPELLEEASEEDDSKNRSMDA